MEEMAASSTGTLLQPVCQDSKRRNGYHRRCLPQVIHLQGFSVRQIAPKSPLWPAARDKMRRLIVWQVAAERIGFAAR
jgi:hypothetical protein